MGDTDSAAFDAFEAAGWQRKARAYDSFFAAITSRAAPALLDAAHVGRGRRVLDLATGPGYAAAAAAHVGAKVVALDVAAAMVALARRRNPGLDVRRGNAESLPFADGSFDAVVSNFGLMHFGRPERVLGEVTRVLAGGGRVALSVWDRPGRARLAGLFADAIAEVGAAPPPELPPGPAFFRFADDGELTRLLAGAGLVEPRIDRVAFEHRLDSADELWDRMLAGTVRTAAAIAGQPVAVRRSIRAAFDRLAEPYAADGGLTVPVAVAVGHARKP